jgi:ATP phosphoribosyltransferase
VLKIALPNKGQLAEPAQAMLREAGYLRSHHPRDLVVRDPANDVEFYFLRPRDIAIYIARGTLDVGITGRDLVLDSGSDVYEAMALAFGESVFTVAVPAETTTSDVKAAVVGKRIATAYPRLLQNWLTANSISATVVELDGAVENAVALGVADAVADVVDTGTTVRQAGLEVVGEPILQSEAVLIVRPDTKPSDELDRFTRRLNSVLVARKYVMVDYDIDNENLAKAVAITPGLESPTIAPLHKEGWVAVRALVLRSNMHEVMDDLYAVGARGILLTDLHGCRL